MRKQNKMTEIFKGKKRYRERSREKYLSELAKWHGRRKAFKLIGNMKDCTRWRSMMTNAIQHGT